MIRFTHRINQRVLAGLGATALFCVPSAAFAQAFGEKDDVANAEILDLTGVEVDEFDTFNIQVQDTDLNQVLQMLALQSERNVIASRNVSAVISANLFDVTFYEALDAILKPNGFRWVEEGKFVYVYTQEEFARMEALDRKTESRRFELEHLSAQDAATFVEPIKSDRGKISYIGEVQGGIEQNLGDMGADTWAKSAILVVNDYPERLQRIAELLDEIDTPPRQVVVDATIASVAVKEDDAFGVDFALIGNLDITKLVSPLGPVTDLLRGNTPPTDAPGAATPVYGSQSDSWGIQSTAGNTASGPANMKLGLVAGDAAVFVRALDQVTDTMVLARPRLMALNRQRAQVLVGERVAYLSTTSTDTTTTQTVQYLDTGVKLMLRPFISKDDSIRMELYPSVSNAQLRPITAGGAAGSLLVPDEFTNEISTNVKVRDGQTLVLGGLFQEETRVTNSQVPFLGDIPILGAAFGGHDNEVRRREIIFLITPNIVDDELVEMSGSQGMAFVNSLRAGMREGLLPFSREKMSSQRNQNAFDAMNDGDFELALYHFDNSLRLNPAQPEVRRMRAKLTGESGGDFYDYDIWLRVMENQHQEHEEDLDQEARLNTQVDPLGVAAGGVEETSTARPSNSVDAFVDELVSDLDIPEMPTEVASASDVEAYVEESPAESFDSEETAFETVVADADIASDPTAAVFEETAPEVVEPVVVTDASDEMECADEPVVEEGWTNQTILEFVGESQTRLVSHPRYSTWGRFWWLAQFASDQIDFVAGEYPASSDDSSIATVTED